MSLLKETIDSAIELLPERIIKDKDNWFDHFWETNFLKNGEFPDMAYGLLYDRKN